MYTYTGSEKKVLMMKTTINPRGVNVDALLAAINEISESEIHRAASDPHHVSVDGREYHTWHELAEAFELDIHDFSITEVTR